MRKTQSKKMNQLKYLVLIPVLASMLFYTSCAVNKDKVIAKKELQTIYSQFDKGLEIIKGEKKTYLDIYTGSKKPNWDEISYKDLSSKEKLEYDNHVILFKERDNSVSKSSGLKVYKGKNGRNIIGKVFDMSKNRTVRGTKINVDKDGRFPDGSVSFMTIDKVPTFPGCEEGGKKCFSKMVQKHFSKNFDSKMVNTLGLESGRKRVFIGFRIDEEGNVVNVAARAPHPKIKAEVIKVMNTLPKMIPGEHKGKKVVVKYSIPFTLLVE